VAPANLGTFRTDNTMFVVVIGTVVTFVEAIANPTLFAWSITVWLFLTVDPGGLVGWSSYRQENRRRRAQMPASGIGGDRGSLDREPAWNAVLPL
jgi:hypothetical protein